MTNIWITSIASGISITIGGWFVITYIFPLLEDLLKTVVKDKKSLNSFMSLLNILLIWMIAQGIVIYLLRINNPYLEYLESIAAGLDVILEFLPYLKWIIVGWFAFLLFKKR